MTEAAEASPASAMRSASSSEVMSRPLSSSTTSLSLGETAFNTRSPSAARCSAGTLVFFGLGLRRVSVNLQYRFSLVPNPLPATLPPECLPLQPLTLAAAPPSQPEAPAVLSPEPSLMSSRPCPVSHLVSLLCNKRNGYPIPETGCSKQRTEHTAHINPTSTPHPEMPAPGLKRPTAHDNPASVTSLLNYSI
eukprot:CAMPEP_0118929748 /NCGR_PEP_ID=MMETSP1169-20130426/6656_1 /TAXON_ID=36882 /ORGANISM="Pyramimonas obovata, Strain CCMP722" /LENGTH=191 /DNA_ID=CAMNT_0006871997 /DNA_START=365 /DNA_END=941 /DNA_ORIENTATION=-